MSLPSRTTLKVLPAASCPARHLAAMSGSPAAARNVVSMSWWETMPLRVTPACHFAGQRRNAGTR